MIFIHSKDLTRIFDISYPTAYRRYQTMKSALKKKEHQHISLEEFCKYEGLEVENIKKNYFPKL